jgi:hypothetical protein
MTITTLESCAKSLANRTGIETAVALRIVRLLADGAAPTDFIGEAGVEVEAPGLDDPWIGRAWAVGGRGRVFLRTWILGR